MRVGPGGPAGDEWFAAVAILAAVVLVVAVAAAIVPHSRR
jgi:hypothetical protein